MMRLTGFLLAIGFLNQLPAANLQRVRFNHPGLVVDLGVGLWAWPRNCSPSPDNS